MAIVVEEERHSQVNWVSILVWLVVLGLVISTVYVVFFKIPPLIEQAVPVTFQTTKVLSEIQIKPEEIIQSQLFNSLQRYVPPVPTGAIESPRANPFLAVPFGGEVSISGGQPVSTSTVSKVGSASVPSKTGR